VPLFDDDFLFDASGQIVPVPVPPTPPSGYLGRFQIGQTVPLAVVPVDSGGFPSPPDSAPVATVQDPSNTTVGILKMALGGDPEHFAIGFFLRGGLALGTYQVTYAYRVNGASLGETGSFDVIPGGDPGGAVIAMVGYDRPEARYVVAQLASGRLVQGKNPRVT
jgi:hypothetical protein